MKLKQSKLGFKLAAMFFTITFISGSVSLIIVSTLVRNSYEQPIQFYSRINAFSSIISLLISLLICMVLGTIMTATVSSQFLKPIRSVNKAMDEIAKGNYDIQLPVPNDTEFGKLTANFNKMAKELGSVETLRNDFIVNVSHEFKTPIASILGFANLLQNENISPERRKEYCDFIIEESLRLSKLSTNILRLSKLENQEDIGEKEEFRLDEQLRRAILSMESAWSEKDIALEVNLDEINTYGNREMLQQVWINLLGNAVKFTPKSGNVSVTAAGNDETVTVTVTDSGIGMNEDVSNHIFEKFYQGENSHVGEGNGLGLALVKRIVDLSDGTISVASKLGSGSVFTVTLPARCPNKNVAEKETVYKKMSQQISQGPVSENNNSNLQ